MDETKRNEIHDHQFDKVVARQGPGNWIELSLWVCPSPNATLRDALIAFADKLPHDDSEARDDEP